MKLAELSVQEFGALLGSEAPAPGGGAAAALSGALGAALTSMVAALTVGKDGCGGAWELAAAARGDAEALRERFVSLMQRDADAFDDFMRALSLPREDAAQKAARTEAMQAALAVCTRSPLDTMALALEGLRLLSPLIGASNRNVVSDLGVAAVQLRAAAEGAWFNVLVNTKSLKDRALAEGFQQRARELLREVRALSDDCRERAEALL